MDGQAMYMVLFLSLEVKDLYGNTNHYRLVVAIRFSRNKLNSYRQYSFVLFVYVMHFLIEFLV